jgi:hypothetical protein
MKYPVQQEKGKYLQIDLLGCQILVSPGACAPVDYRLYANLFIMPKVFMSIVTMPLCSMLIV